MSRLSRLRLLTRISLYLFFFVILAGSIVRSTGSGMGCPDWPRCFGHYIPPTSAEELLYTPGASYRKGQMVLRNDTLWVANGDLLGGTEFSRREWHKYPKHDYATFVPLQTWIEYLNRLATGLFAVPLLLLAAFAWSYGKRERDFIPLLLAIGSLVFTGFEAWVGKLVVDGNLRTGSVTLHMMGSLLITLCLTGLLVRIREYPAGGGRSVALMPLLWTLLAVLAQVIMGTQVREQTDTIAQHTADRSLWIGQMDFWFYIHRSFSILLVGLIWWSWTVVKDTGLRQAGVCLMLLTGAEVVAGIVLSYLHMPAAVQPIHLLLAVMMFSAAAFLVFAAFRMNRLRVMNEA